MEKQPSRLCKCRVTSNTQLIGLGEDNFQNRHESRGFAEIAGADYVRVDVQSFLVVVGFNALHNVVQTANDGWRELQGSQARQVRKRKKPAQYTSARKTEILSVTFGPQEGAAVSSFL